MKTVTDFIFLGCKINVDGCYSHEIKRWKKSFFPWKKSYDKPRQHVKKQRHYSANNVRSVKAMVVPVVRYGCEIWTVKKSEHQNIDALNCGVGKDS